MDREPSIKRHSPGNNYIIIKTRSYQKTLKFLLRLRSRITGMVSILFMFISQLRWHATKKGNMCTRGADACMRTHVRLVRLSVYRPASLTSYLVLNFIHTMSANIDHLSDFDGIIHVAVSFEFFSGTFPQYLAPATYKQVCQRVRGHAILDLNTRQSLRNRLRNVTAYHVWPLSCKKTNRRVDRSISR